MQKRRLGKLKSNKARRATHTKKYGVASKLPPRGTGRK